MRFNSQEEFEREYDRLWKWRDLWTRLSNRNNCSDNQDKRSSRARFLASLQTRDEAVQRRAWIKNQQIGELMKEIDAWRAAQIKKPVFDPEAYLFRKFARMYSEKLGVVPNITDKYDKANFEIFKMGWEACKKATIKAA